MVNTVIGARLSENYKQLLEFIRQFVYSQPDHFILTNPNTSKDTIYTVTFCEESEVEEERWVYGVYATEKQLFVFLDVPTLTYDIEWSKEEMLLEFKNPDFWEHWDSVDFGNCHMYMTLDSLNESLDQYV